MAHFVETGTEILRRGDHFVRLELLRAWTNLAPWKIYIVTNVAILVNQDLRIELTLLGQHLSRRIA